MAGVSTEAEVGEILIIIDIIIGAFGVLAMLAASRFIQFFAPLGFFLYGLMGAATIVLVAGLVVSYLAYKETVKKDYHTAGIYAVIAAFLPPIRIITIIGAIFCLISPEASRKTKKRKR